MLVEQIKYYLKLIDLVQNKKWSMVTIFCLSYLKFDFFKSIFLILAYSFDGLLVVVMLTICTCGYIRRIPKLRQFLLTEKKGFAGIFYKGNKLIS